MATLLPNKPSTPTQRSARAVEHTAERLGLGDQKLLAVALMEAAADEVVSSPRFSEQIRARYLALTVKPSQGGTTTRQPATTRGTSAAVRPKVATSRTRGEHVDIVSPLDPRTLVPLYGSGLPVHLTEYSVKELSQMARLLAPKVGEKAPPQKDGKATLVSYIVRHTAGRY